MINSERRPYVITRNTPTIDEYGQRTFDYSTGETVYLSIVYSDEIELNNPAFADVKFIGMYWGTPRVFEKNDKISNKYIVERVIKAGRLTYLLLKEL